MNPTCQAVTPCNTRATQIVVAGFGAEPNTLTLLACDEHLVTARKLVGRTSSAIVFNYALATDPSVEILHTRDPDTDCGVRVWIDGVEQAGVYVEDIDPGRGYDDDSWEENVEATREADTSPAFKEAALAAYAEMESTQKKWSV